MFGRTREEERADRKALYRRGSGRRQKVLTFKVLKVADSADKKSASEMYVMLAGGEEGKQSFRE